MTVAFEINVSFGSVSPHNPHDEIFNIEYWMLTTKWIVKFKILNLASAILPYFGERKQVTYVPSKSELLMFSYFTVVCSSSMLNFMHEHSSC